MKRSRAYRRYQRQKAIKRKRNILLNVYRITEEQREKSRYFIDGRLDKGKVHCSCPMCSDKKYYRAKYKKGQKLSLESDLFFYAYFLIFVNLIFPTF